MNPQSQVKFDEIGNWSEIKLEIIKKYAAAYSTILAKQQNLYHVYVDAFAGAGEHKLKSTGQFVPGSPLNALWVEPPFKKYYLIDIDRRKVAHLRKLLGERADVQIYEGDCNAILLEKVFPNIRYDRYRRGLCLLDPYGLDLEWKVIETAGKMKSIDMFLNFPVADIHRNVLWRHPEGVAPADVERMNRLWGDLSWRQIAYTTKRSLFGELEKEDIEVVADGFRQRLKKVAGFNHVPEPLPMRNSKGAVIYYLFFASQKPAAEHIISEIFSKYRQRGRQ